MKTKVIKLTVSELKEHIQKIISEQLKESHNEEHISSPEDELKQKAEEAVQMLSPEEQQVVADFIQNNPKEFMSVVKHQVAQEKQEDLGEDEENIGMDDNEFEARRILHKIINYVGPGALMATVPAAMFIGGGVALGLGITALGANMIKDAAFWKKGGKYNDHHYKAQNKAERMDVKEQGHIPPSDIQHLKAERERLKKELAKIEAQLISVPKNSGDKPHDKMVIDCLKKAGFKSIDTNGKYSVYMEYNGTKGLFRVTNSFDPTKYYFTNNKLGGELVITPGTNCKTIVDTVFK